MQLQQHATSRQQTAFAATLRLSIVAGVGLDQDPNGLATSQLRHGAAGLPAEGIVLTGPGTRHHQMQLRLDRRPGVVSRYVSIM